MMVISMKIKSLDKEEQDLILESLIASLEGPFFPEWEFDSLFGGSRAELSRIIQNYPEVSFHDEKTKSIILNALGNLVGYPHGKEALWSEYISASKSEVFSLLKKLKKRCSV